MEVNEKVGMTVMLLAIGIILILSCTGCSHNIYAKGVGAATPYFALGYGEISCVKDNVTITSKESVKPDGSVEMSSNFTVKDQVTGYDVEIAK